MVERWVPMPAHPGGGYRKDYLGIIDLICINEVFTIGVQSCGQDFAVHLKTVKECDMTPLWLECVDREMWVIGWRKLLKKRGGKLKIWSPRIEIIKRREL